jgi:polysaccharide pyruvyl transferase WcaK-like protein
MSKMRNKSYILKDGYTPTELMGVIGLMDMVISMRLHTLIFAANQRVPMLGFIYDPKIDYYLQLFDMPSGGDINVYDMNSAFTKVKDILDNRDVYVKKLEKTAGMMELKAEENVKYLLKLLQTDKRGRNIWKEK